ncbi:MAG: hypothetical protein R2883_02455 [Caldisericia bacterium]
MLSDKGELVKELSEFKTDPMQFIDPQSVAACAGGGLAVFDLGKGLIQFFNESGPLEIQRHPNKQSSLFRLILINRSSVIKRVAMR